MSQQPGTFRHLRSDRPGVRPGDLSGLVRSLIDGELFFNSADLVICWLQSNGRMRTFALVDAESFPAWFATMLAPLPTTSPPTGSGIAWNNGGVLTVA